MEDNGLQLDKNLIKLNDFRKALEKANISQKQLNTLTKELNKAHKELNLVKRTEDYTKAQQKLNKEYREWSRSLEMIKNVAVGVFSFDSIRYLDEMAIKMIKFNSEMHRNLVLSGKNGEAMKGYQKTLNNLSMQLGATHEDANNVVKALATRQYAGTAKDIDTAAAATYKLAEATKISKEEIAQATVELQKWGQISAQTTEAMYADIMKVAMANGLTQEGIKAILKQTQNWSGVMKAFGKSPQDVQRYNLSLSKTVSALEKVGISAQETTSLLDKLTDPEKVEENIALYAALGMSIEDALSGDLTGEDMAVGLKDFGEKLKTMGPIAGAQYAKAFGVSYKQAIKATAADFDELNKFDMTPEEKASKELSAAMESTRNSVEKINALFEKIGGKIRETGPLFAIGLISIFTFFEKMFTKTFTDAGKKFVGIFSKSGKEAADNLSNSMSDAANKSGEALKTGMYGGAIAALADINKAKEESYSAERKRRRAMEKQEAKEYQEFLYQATEAVAKGKVDIDRTADLVFIDKEISAQEKLGEIKQAQFEKTRGYLENLKELEQARKDLVSEGDKGAQEVLELRIKQLEDMKKLDEEAMKGLSEAAEKQQKAIDKLAADKAALKPKLENDIAEALDSKAFNVGKMIGDGIHAVDTKIENVGQSFAKVIDGLKNGKIEIGDTNEAEKRLKDAVKESGITAGENVEKAVKDAAKEMKSIKIEIDNGEKISKNIKDAFGEGSEGASKKLGKAKNINSPKAKGGDGKKNGEKFGEGAFGNILKIGKSFGESVKGVMQRFKPNKIEVGDCKDAAKNIGGAFDKGTNAIDKSAKNMGESVKGGSKALEEAAKKQQNIKPKPIKVEGGREEGKKLNTSAFTGIAAIGKKMGDGLSSAAKRIKIKVSGGKSAAKDFNKNVNSEKIGAKAGRAFAKSAGKTKVKSKLKISPKSIISAGKKMVSTFKNGLKNFKIGVKSAAGNSKVLGAMGKLGGALGGVAKVAGKLGGAMGIVAIVMRIIGKALEKMEGPMDMINTIMDNLVGILTPILEAILRPLLPLIQVLIKALLPPLLKILSLLIKVLHILMKPIVMLIKALGNIPGLGFLKDVAEGIDKVTGPEVTGALDAAAEKISDSNIDLAKKTEENTEAVEGKTKGESLSFSGGKVMVRSSTSNAGSSDSESGTSTTSNSSTSEESSTKSGESQMLTIAALSKVKESIDNLNNKFTVFMNKMNDTFDKMASSDSTKMYQERAAIEQAFGLDERKIVNVNIADAAGVISGGRNVIRNIFGGGGGTPETHTIPEGGW